MSNLNLKINIFNLFFRILIILIILKLLFSYLSVELHYFQRELISDYERFNFFNFNRNFSSKIEFILTPLLLIFIILYNKYYKQSIYFIIVSALAVSINIFTAIIHKVSLFDSLSLSLKFFTPIYFFCALIIYSKRQNNDLRSGLLRILLLCISLSFVAILFFNPSLNRLNNYLPIYFANIHTNSYIITSTLIGFSYLIYRSQQRLILVLFLTLSVILIYLGYGVRTATIMFVIFCLPLIYFASDIFKLLIFKILLCLPFLAAFFFLVKVEFDWTNFSSGRTLMYQQKINQLRGFNLVDWAIGKGAGADLIQTDVWWWAKKGAHSDFITVLVENGLIYFALMILSYLMLLILIKRINLIFAALVFSSFFSSIISNGMAFRPHANYIFYFVLAYIYVDIINNSKNRELTTT